MHRRNGRGGGINWDLPIRPKRREEIFFTEAQPITSKRPSKSYTHCFQSVKILRTSIFWLRRTRIFPNANGSEHTIGDIIISNMPNTVREDTENIYGEILRISLTRCPYFGRQARNPRTPISRNLRAIGDVDRNDLGRRIVRQSSYVRAQNDNAVYDIETGAEKDRLMVPQNDDGIDTIDRLNLLPIGLRNVTFSFMSHTSRNGQRDFSSIIRRRDRRRLIKCFILFGQPQKPIIK